MSLALSTLIYEWRRYLAAIIALAFSGLLVLAQVGMFIGIGQAFSATIDRSPADIMVLGAKAEGLFNGGASLPARILPTVFMHPEVAQVRDLDGDGGMWRVPAREGGKPKNEWVQIMVVDPYPGSVTLPTDFPPEVWRALQEPFAVVVDKTSLARLGVKVGEKATLNGKSVRVRATIEGYPNMMQAMVVTSRDTLRLLGLAYGSDRVGPLMVRLKDPTKAEQVVAQLNEAACNADGQMCRYRAWTRPQLARANEGMMMKEAIIGVMLGFSVFLGLLIGVGITSQTLRGAILANIKEFASLRALGVSMGSLRRIVLELSFWVGVAGLAATAVLTTAVASAAKAAGVPMGFTPPFVIGVSIFLMIIALLSGMLALGILKKSQPADLLR